MYIKYIFTIKNIVTKNKLSWTMPDILLVISFVLLTSAGHELYHCATLSNLSNQKTKESMCTIKRKTDIKCISKNNNQRQIQTIRVQQFFNCGKCIHR